MASQWSWDAGGATEINYRPYSPSVNPLLEAAWVPAQAAFSNEIVIDVPGGRARVYKHPRKGLIQERCDNANAWRAVRRVTATAVQNIDSVDLDDSDDEPPPIPNNLLAQLAREREAREGGGTGGDGGGDGGGGGLGGGAPSDPAAALALMQIRQSSPADRLILDMIQRVKQRVKQHKADATESSSNGWTVKVKLSPAGATPLSVTAPDGTRLQSVLAVERLLGLKPPAAPKAAGGAKPSRAAPSKPSPLLRPLSESDERLLSAIDTVKERASAAYIKGATSEATESTDDWTVRCRAWTASAGKKAGAMSTQLVVTAPDGGKFSSKLGVERFLGLKPPSTSPRATTADGKKNKKRKASAVEWLSSSEDEPEDEDEPDDAEDPDGRSGVPVTTDFLVEEIDLD